MINSVHADTLHRIESAIEATRKVFSRFTPGAIEAEYKVGHDPVTEADRQLDAALREELLRDGEGWLSEESVDDPARLKNARVWVVDPLDGTREFVAGVPEYCVSIAMVENGLPVAGGIFNPATNETFLGSLDSGLTYNGRPAKTTQRTTLSGAVVLASRSETKRGEWKQFQDAAFQVRPMGSVAYKLALVAAGLADATFTLSPKNEWDVAAGIALVECAGGHARTLDGNPVECNNRNPLLSGLFASGSGLEKSLTELVRNSLNAARPAAK